MYSALEYFELFGEQYRDDELSGGYLNRRLRLNQAPKANQTYEFGLCCTLLEVLEETPGFTIHGLRDLQRLEKRVPTFAFNMEGSTPQEVAEELGMRDI